MVDSQAEITHLVERWSQGDETALNRLVDVAYEDLRVIAHRQFRSMPTDTMGTTALVHELYLKLAGISEGSWGGRKQFFAFCSKAMRHILISHARRRSATKRGGGDRAVPLTPELAAVDAEALELLAVDEALGLLAERNPRMAKIVECRVFGGLSMIETAEAVDASKRTVEREWARARVYLSHVLTREG